MRILIVGHALRGGGAEFVTVNWANELASRGREVTVLTLDQDPAEHLLSSDVRHIDTYASGALGHLSRLRAVRTNLDAGGFDVCLAMQTYPALVMLAARRRRHTAKFLISERNMPSLLLRREGASQRVQLEVARLLYPRADGMIAISHAVAADAISSLRVPQDRCFVVQNPAVAKVGSRPPARTPGSDSGLTIVLPFRLAAQKRPLLSVQVAAELRGRGVEARVVSFGAGPLEHDLKSFAQQLQVPLDVAGWDNEWFDHCPPNSVVLLPSHTEGFGNVLVEAAARQIPSVAWSGALGVADAIVPRVTGVLTTADTPSDFADAVLDAADLPMNEATAWLDRFTVAASVDTLERAIAVTIDRRKSKQ